MSLVLRRAIALMVLVGGTLFFFGLYDRYEPIGPELLINPEFTEGFSHWDVSGRGSAEAVDGTAVLRIKERGAGVAVRQTLPNPQRYHLLRLSGELQAQDIRPGARFWHKGRLVLASFDKEQRMMPVPHIAADLTGTRPWQFHQQVFRIPEDVHEIRVGVQLIGATGTLVARNISVREARQREHYTLYRGVGMVVWAVALVWMGWPYASRLRLDLPHLIIFVTLIGVFAGTLMPGQVKLKIETQLVALISRGTPLAESSPGIIGEIFMSSILIGKLGHLLAFATLAFALSWAHPQENKWFLLVGLLILASVSEILQFFVDGRLPQLIDFFIDGLGLLMGMILFAALHRLVPIVQRKGTKAS